MHLIADDDLVQTLNLLLDSLDIPIELESVLDLTPTLLLAILESTLSSRLPLSSKLRAADSRQSVLFTSLLPVVPTFSESTG